MYLVMTQFLRDDKRKLGKKHLIRKPTNDRLAIYQLGRSTTELESQATNTGDVKSEISYDFITRLQYLKAAAARFVHCEHS